MSTKRLTDADAARRWDAMFGVGEEDAPQDLEALRDDHLQARRDVATLAEMLRWAVDHDLFRNEDEEKDGEVQAFLREVEAVRQ